MNLGFILGLHLEPLAICIEYIVVYLKNGDDNISLSWFLESLRLIHIKPGIIVKINKILK